MCINRGPNLPQLDYGQGQGAFNPSTRAPVYQQVDKARRDGAFARDFAADILLGKPDSGEKIYTNPYTTKHTRTFGGDTYTYETTHNSVKPNKGGKGPDYLYNRNSLNAASSWVPQAFSAPALRGENGNWYQADLWQGKGETESGWDFAQGKQITDAETLRRLNQGTYAFAATGVRGTQVYVPWAEGYVPAKGGHGAPEAGNRKQEAENTGNTNRRIPTVGTAMPGNVIGGNLDRNKLG
jgi:hypothetical protein